MNKNDILNFISNNLAHMEAYHNHKENMANAGFLVQMGLFGSVITENIWPPKWVAESVPYPQLSTFSVYFFLWFLVHYYTRWQLINKRVAAMYTAGLSKAYLYGCTHNLSDNDHVLYEGDAFKQSPLKDFLNKIIYIPGGFQKMDATINGYPAFIAKEIKQVFNGNSGAVSLEILMTYASFVLLAIMAIKIF